MKKKELDFINEKIPIFELEHAEKRKVPLVTFTSQYFAAMLAELEKMKASNQNTYCGNFQMMVGSEPAWLSNEDGFLCRRSTVEGSIQIIVPQKYREAVLQHGHYQKLVGSLGIRRMQDLQKKQSY